MELQGFCGSMPIVRLEPSECALLASLCDQAFDKYGGIEDGAKLTAGLTLASMFRVLAIAGISACELTSDLYEQRNKDMEALGLVEVVQGLDPASAYRHRMEREQAEKA